MEEDRYVAEEMERRKEEMKLEEAKQLKSTLHQQMGELRKREAEVATSNYKCFSSRKTSY